MLCTRGSLSVGRSTWGMSPFLQKCHRIMLVILSVFNVSCRVFLFAGQVLFALHSKRKAAQILGILICLSFAVHLPECDLFDLHVFVSFANMCSVLTRLRSESDSSFKGVNHYQKQKSIRTQSNGIYRRVSKSNRILLRLF